jgi:hypothetical protein
VPRLVFLIRFLSVTPPVPPVMWGAFAGALGLAAFVLLLDPRRASAALMPVLLLQTFAVSSGMVASARRGHYDLPLTSGHGRVPLAVAHWAMSALPGVGSWLAVAAMESIMTRRLPQASFASGTLAAMCVISTLPWALTVRLPRLTGGIAWMLALTAAATLLPPTPLDMLVPGLAGLAGPAAALAFLLCPWLVVGQPLAPSHIAPVLSMVVVVVAVMAGALIWLDQTDVPLEAAQ